MKPALTILILLAFGFDTFAKPKAGVAFCLLNPAPCFAELTENDIRRVVREEIAPLRVENAEIKGKMATKDDIINIYQKLSDKIDTLYGIIIVSFVTLIVVIAVPQIIIAYRERRESRLSKEVDKLKKRIAELERKQMINSNVRVK
jgi:hypothetical protein